MLLILSLLFLFGLFIGSFLNVVIDRVPKGESFVLPSSHCDHCKKHIAWFDNIPVFSFLFLRGKCRHCRKHISFYYPAVELIAGLMFVLIFSNYQLSIFNFQSLSNVQFPMKETVRLLYYFFTSASLIAIFFTDLKYEIIPNAVVYPAVFVSLLYIILTAPYVIQNALLSALGAFLFFFLIFAGTKGRGMGFGDVQLAFLMGFFLGFPAILVAFYTAFLTGGIVSLILILWKKKKFRGSTLPFGPFLVFGTFFALFFSKNIIAYFLPGVF